MVPRLELRVTEEYLVAELPTERCHGAREVVELIKPLVRSSAVEEFWAVLLDPRHRVQGMALISTGCLTWSVVHPREVFGPAVHAGAAAVIVAHNHPSGDHRPSRQDIAVTERLARCGHLLGVPLLDHVIIGRDGWTSLRAEGHMADAVDDWSVAEATAVGEGSPCLEDEELCPESCCGWCRENYPDEEHGQAVVKRGEYQLCQECLVEWDQETGDSWNEGEDWEPIDGVGFADPGGSSALRAATADNPRTLPCPTCDAPDRLTPADKRRGYQCDSCADLAERGLP